MSTPSTSKDWEPVEQKPKEMAPSAFQTKAVLNGSINRNSLCRDISFFFFFLSNFRPFAVSAAETREPGLQGSLYYFFFLLREKRNKVTLPHRSEFSFPLPAVTPSFPGLFLPHLAEYRCQNLVLTNSLRRERRESSSTTGWKPKFSLCSELAANTREPPGDRRDGGQGKEGRGME